MTTVTLLSAATATATGPALMFTSPLAPRPRHRDEPPEALTLELADPSDRSNEADSRADHEDRVQHGRHHLLAPLLREHRRLRQPNGNVDHPGEHPEHPPAGDRE